MIVRREISRALPEFVLCSFGSQSSTSSQERLLHCCLQLWGSSTLKYNPLVLSMLDIKTDFSLAKFVVFIARMDCVKKAFDDV